MIELGTMSVRDQDSLSEVRGKVLGLAKAFQCGEVLATRAATAVSEAARRCLGSSAGVLIRVELLGDDTATHLRLVFESGGPPIDREPLRLFFDRVISNGRPDGATVAAEIALPVAGGPIDRRIIHRERERIARKSRNELMDELRDKNRQLEEYNESLEATVAERTAELRNVNAKLQSELDAGAAYVRALIPAPLNGTFCVDWRYVPSSNLGGDTIGYHWLDDDHLALYLIDVTGHGLDSALLAVTVTNVIRTGSLSGADMKRADEVLAALNDAFQSDQHGRKFFTIWYGVYQPSIRRLTWSGGGHHPSVLLQGDGPQAAFLESSGPMMGIATGMPFEAFHCTVPPSSRLLIFSDGVFEILRDGRVVWGLEEVNDYLTKIPWSETSVMDHLLNHVHALKGSTQLDDDFSIIEARFA
jgi:serine phosphatase RsbU (regulator of sigma subunit)